MRRVTGIGGIFMSAKDLLERDWIRRERGRRTLIVAADDRSGVHRALRVTPHFRATMR